MSKLITNLWFDANAEEAAAFYCSLLPDSRVGAVHRAPADNPSTAAGAVLTVEFTLAGQRFIGLNGGPTFQFTEAVSLMIDCADQDEVDFYWDALIADGGQPSQCGWLKDKFGLSWQVIPRALGEYLGGSDPAGAARAMEAMLEMGKIDVAALREAYEGSDVALP